MVEVHLLNMVKRIFSILHTYLVSQPWKYSTQEAFPMARNVWSCTRFTVKRYKFLATLHSEQHPETIITSDQKRMW